MPFTPSNTKVFEFNRSKFFSLGTSIKYVHEVSSVTMMYRLNSQETLIAAIKTADLSDSEIEALVSKRTSATSNIREIGDCLVIVSCPDDFPLFVE